MGLDHIRQERQSVLSGILAMAHDDQFPDEAAAILWPA
jgi:hypothetical protein